jgi:transposase InsO family protein
MNARGRSWRPPFSPLEFWNTVPARETQTTLRRCFARRGLPQRIRVDNGMPWRSKGDLPTGLELWLAGLGVEVRANPPRRPQDNGVVERSQGTGKRWAEPHQAASAADLQTNLDAMDRRQRESYPYHGRASRLSAHPDLEHSGRSYDESQEEPGWSLEKARDLLAGFVVPRRVDRSGMASVYNRNYYVGKAYAEQVVHVRYDPQQQLWLFQDREGHQLNRQKVSEINATNIRGLMEIERRVRSKKTGEEQLDVAIAPE